MPYIDGEHRKLFEYQGNYQHPRTAGELNYLITMMVDKYVKEKGVNYQSYNDVMGALEGCKLELYRRRISPYEDEKILQNGDVF